MSPFPRQPCPVRPWLAAVLALALVAGACGHDPELVPAVPELAVPGTARLTVAGRPIDVELATTADQRRLGLMHRTSLPPDHGMLFLFTEAKPRTFWMHDTLIDLDMVFIGADGVVQNIEHARAGVERPGYHSRGLARFVLEMAAGWSAEAGLQPGQTIEVPPELAARAEPDPPLGGVLPAGVRSDLGGGG